MNKLFFITAAVAALAACDNSDTNTASADANAAAAANTAEIVLPPSITASHSYRCKDNSLVYIDWMSDGGARAKAKPEEIAAAVATDGDAPELTGDSSSTTVTYKGQSCNRG